MTTRTLVCEICREPIATFEQEELSNPLNLRIFRSLYPERQVPDPFPPALDDWRVAICPRCRRRPFLNFYEKSEGQYIITTGEVVPEGGQWFVLALNDSGQFEKVLLSPVKQSEPAPELPPQEPTKPEPQPESEESEESTDQEPTGNYKSPPVTCPGCGKQFRSAGRMAKYHKDCPAKTRPPQEGFKI